MYLSKIGLRWHGKRGADGHDFPEGFTSETKLAMMISQPGRVMAGGNVPNRLSHSSHVDCYELQTGATGSTAARCRGKFNRPRRRKAYYKPERLRAELNNLFLERPVLTPQQAWLCLRAMHESDGTCTFSISQAGSVQTLAKDTICIGCGLNPCSGCRGKLLHVGDIKSDFKAQARKRKGSYTTEKKAKRQK